MGDYAVVTDVDTRLQNWPEPGTLGSGTTPTDTEVDSLIDQYEGEINGVLKAKGYQTVPATGANDINMLKAYVATRVAAEVWMIVYGDDEAPYQIEQWMDGYNEFIKRLRMGAQYLVDQTPEGAEEAGFLIVRHVERDDTFTYQYQETDWDE